jgi:hypothetical protein
MNVQSALKGQYHAALAMLKQAIEQCPDDLWDGGSYPVPFWRVAYHTLYYTHLYLQQSEAAFRPWEHHRDGYNDLPRPPPASKPALPAVAKEPPRSGPADSGPKIDDPYTKGQILNYWRLIDGRIDADLDRLDLEAPQSGFSWHNMIPKFEHQIHNIRHIQHHAALLSGRVRLALGANADLRWMRTNGQTYRP